MLRDRTLDVAVGDRGQDEVVLGQRRPSPFRVVEVADPPGCGHQVEDVDDPQEDVVPGRSHDLGVEPAVVAGDPLRVVEIGEGLVKDLLHPLEVDVGAPGAGQLDGLDLVDEAHLDGLADVVVAERYADLAEQCERLDARLFLRHEQARLGAPLDDPERLEVGDRLPDLAAPDLEAQAEIALGGDAFARLVPAVDQEPHELLHERLLVHSLPRRRLRMAGGSA